MKRLMALIALAVPAFAAPGAFASPPAPSDLRVVGGDGWHADNAFSLDWNSPPATAPALTRTHYRVRDPQGTTIASEVISKTEDGVGPLIVPAVPGSYTAEVWFEDASGAQGPVATAQLRFDDTRPSAIEPGPVPAWIGRVGFPLRIRLGRPAGPPPLAGIRGYAISIAAAPSATPCHGGDLCSEAETTLRGGFEDDELEIAALPEGTSYLHAVAVSGSGMRSPASGRAELRVDLTDPVTRLAGVPAGWTNRAVSLLARATDSGAGMTDSTGLPPFTAIRIDGGAPVSAAGATVATTVVAEGTHRVAYYARDGAGNVDDGAWSNGIANRSPRTATVRIDRTPPSVAFAGSQDPRDPELVRARIEDGLSGPDPVRGGIGVRRVGSGDGFRALPTTVGEAGEMRARWESDSYPAGEYEFRAVAYDAAGNVALTRRRRNGSAMVLSNPLKATTALVARLGGRAGPRSVPYGRGIRLAGRLTTGIRAPLAGMPVRIVERFAPGPTVRVSTARTAADGTWSIHLPPGPSREVEATFAGSATLGRSTYGPLRLGVRSAVRLGASSGLAKIGGPPLVFRGRIAPAEAIPAPGKSVQLQFRLPGSAWSEFRTIQTDRQGRFRYAYRFSDDDSRGARFQFRAYAPAQENWPYEPSGSRPVLVEGV
ncbi:MAG TPA: hypothetical protein VIS95_09000 [Solirubrobacterales bacterium]